MATGTAHCVLVHERASEAEQRALVEAARTDPTAFAQLYRAYVSRIHAFAYRRSGSREVAEDVTASTFERAWRSMEGFEWRGGGFEPWLFRIAANELTAHFRRQVRARSDRAQQALREMAADLAEDPALAAVLRADDQARMTESLRDAMARINPRYEQAISLRYLAGLSAEEAAGAMGCTKPVLAVTLHRALGALRRELERSDG